MHPNPETDAEWYDHLCQMQQRHNTLRNTLSYLYGAQERDPNYSSEDQTQLEQGVAEMNELTEQMKGTVDMLRKDKPEVLAVWIDTSLGRISREQGEARYPLSADVYEGILARWEALRTATPEDFFSYPL